VGEGELRALLREHASRHAVPGAAIGVLHDGAAATAFFGVEDVTTGLSVTAQTGFSAGSLTKSMVATVVARLAQEGRLALDDAVGAHVPELRGCRWAERASVRDLMANRSGLPLRADLEFGFDERKEADDGALSRLAADVAVAEPIGEFWSYSNVGWCLLGRAIETATNTAWEYAMGRSLADVGMRDTTFRPDIPRTRVSGHEVTAAGPVPVEPLSGRAYGPAGTTAVTTVDDLLRFAALHLQDPSLAGLRKVHADVSIDGWLDAWCLGWARFEWAGEPVWGWDGLVNGERSVLRLLPDQKAAVALMTNAGTGRAMHRSLLTELVADLFAVGIPALRLEPEPGVPGDLERYAGVYAWPDRRVEVTVTDSGLLIQGEHEREALPLDERTFLIDAADPDNPTVTFGAFDARGRPQVLYNMLWGLPRIDR